MAAASPSGAALRGRGPTLTARDGRKEARAGLPRTAPGRSCAGGLIWVSFDARQPGREPGAGAGAYLRERRLLCPACAPGKQRPSLPVSRPPFAVPVTKGRLRRATRAGDQLLGGGVGGSVHRGFVGDLPRLNLGAKLFPALDEKSLLGPGRKRDNPNSGAGLSC